MDQASAISSGYTAEKETDSWKTYNVTDKKPVRIGKRKRECILDSLDWVKKVARDPLNLVSGSLPERSKWKDFGEELPWRQVLLFRQETMVKRNDATSRVQQSIWKKKQAMLPSMYNDVRHSSRRVEPLADLWLHKYFCMGIPVGTAHQAEIPEWSGNACESDTKWLGTCVWPHEISLEHCDLRPLIGFGRRYQCDCELCVRFHVSEERKRLQLELGMSFYQWHIDKMGVEVASSWTEEEETKFKNIIRSNPPSKGKNFWDEIRENFPLKKREQLMSYYFNVYLHRRRGQQNRNTPMKINSDDDGLEF